VPVLFYAAQMAGLPLMPLTYRLVSDALRASTGPDRPGRRSGGGEGQRGARRAGILGTVVGGPDELPEGDAPPSDLET
jgi:hypothetical protein